jgi:hypothetical protein
MKGTRDKLDNLIKAGADKAARVELNKQVHKNQDKAIRDNSQEEEQKNKLDADKVKAVIRMWDKKNHREVKLGTGQVLVKDEALQKNN